MNELGPHLIGLDPINIGSINRFMDRAMKGHPYVKTGIDIACWDIMGKYTNQPVCELLGGRYGDDFHLIERFLNNLLMKWLKKFQNIVAKVIENFS